jgi:hypothetical protein
MRLSETEEAAFALLAQEVFALDTAIQWFALEKAGRESRCALRDAETGAVFSAVIMPDTGLVDPLVLMLAEGHDGLHGQEESGNPHRLLFVVLVYEDLVEIVARFGRYDHVGVAVNRYADVYTLGRKLTELLDRRKQDSHWRVHADANVQTTKALVVDVSGITNADTTRVEFAVSQGERGAA